MAERSAPSLRATHRRGALSGASRRRHPRPTSPRGLALVAGAGGAGIVGLLLLLWMVAPPRLETREEPGTLEANGLRLQIQNSRWITHDVVGGPTPASIQNGFQMPASMMPGMPAPGSERLFLELVLSDVGQDSVSFTAREFSVRAPNGISWKPNNPALLGPSSLQPGQGRSVDLFFDVPEGVTRLELVWEHGGQLQSIPIDSRPPPPHVHG